MIHELRTYTVNSWQIDEYVEITRTVAMPIREDRHGRLLAYWTTATGSLGQVMHLWEYDDMASRTEVRTALMQNQDWLQFYIPKSQPFLIEQANMILLPKDWYPFDGQHSQLYELRIDQLVPGAMAKWDAAFRRMLDNEDGARPIGLWAVEAGMLNTVVHLWPNSGSTSADAPARTGGRQWQDLDSLTRRTERRLLRPASFSPLQ